jgi:hypothetical protein
MKIEDIWVKAAHHFDQNEMLKMALSQIKHTVNNFMDYNRMQETRLVAQDKQKSNLEILINRAKREMAELRHDNRGFINKNLDLALKLEAEV